MTFNILGVVIDYLTSSGHMGNDVEPFDLAYELDGNTHGLNVDAYIRVRPFIGEYYGEKTVV